MPSVARNSGATPHFLFIIEKEFPLYTLVLLTEALRIANQNSGRSLFTWQVASESRSHYRAGSGAWLPVDSDLEGAEHADVVVVLGGNLPFQQVTKKIVSQLQRFARHGALIGATNTGTIILAAAGLLQDRRVTIHWESIPALLEHYPDTEVVECLFLRDRDRVTCAGGIAALDMILELISDFHGPAMANEVANALVHSRRRGDDRQRPVETLSDADKSLALQMIKVMENNIENPLDSIALAAHLGCSRRTMERAAKLYLHDSPMRLYLKIRLQVARNLLFYDQTAIGEISLICGFSSVSEFSRAFKSCFQKSPREFRSEVRLRQQPSLRPELARLNART
ncbi:MAG: GlxA family transcriptional regulator [Alsobacter sp.]